MQTNDNRKVPGLVTKPHEQEVPSCMIQQAHCWLLMDAVVCCHQGKLPCVAWLHI
uniref:Uncharacterized protein n=1 Tax=Lepeophtheirus salmonis TaxID=72036 RepID=A0A0K2UPQ4_LEPSM